MWNSEKRTGPRWPSGKVSALGLEGSRFESRFRHVWGPPHTKPYVVAKRRPDDAAWKLGAGAPAQASCPSSDYGSKLRDPSQNSPRVASKWDVNITN
ncbi:hypothetical protein AVEN_80134-1 [Araneus ventricosus]|uniref:Uncharacterized protein n=1 Tax=Araneus ventricosus TaxID=182803 RepID=A0A4Y2NA29_ARAVE|nr:hypothetical protein AVEN_80134-1 [Araneus ventricosus]